VYVLVLVFSATNCKFLIDGKEPPTEEERRREERMGRAAYTRDEDAFNEKILWGDFLSHWQTKNHSLDYSVELAIKYFPNAEHNIRKRQYLWACTEHFLHDIKKDYTFANETEYNMTVHGLWKGFEQIFNRTKKRDFCLYSFYNETIHGGLFDMMRHNF
jgi:hypothetical protein